MHPDAEVIFFLGDGLYDAETLAARAGDKAWLVVRGNCDYSSVFRGAPASKTESITLMGKRIVYTHGDLYGVKYGDEGLLRLADDFAALYDEVYITNSYHDWDKEDLPKNVHVTDIINQ